METKWDDKISKGSFSINLYPHYQQLGKVIITTYYCIYFEHYNYLFFLCFVFLIMFF